MPDRYARNAGAVHSLKYHLVWCPKYRRPVLTGRIATRLGQVLRQTAKENEFTIHALEVMPDHVHLFIETDPRWAVTSVVSRLKGRSSHTLREEFPSLRSRLPALWSRSYFAASVGSATESAVRHYIENQKGK